MTRERVSLIHHNSAIIHHSSRSTVFFVQLMWLHKYTGVHTHTHRHTQTHTQTHTHTHSHTHTEVAGLLHDNATNIELIIPALHTAAEHMPSYRECDVLQLRRPTDPINTRAYGGVHVLN